MKVLVLDNYDSFTWNLVQALEALGAKCVVARSDRISVQQISELQPERIVLSPGPFGPAQTGVCREAVDVFSERTPVLGVCLGMQVIATAGGAVVQPSGRPVHGQASPVYHDGHGVLAGLPSPFLAARYHSLQVAPDLLPPEVEISAWTEEGIIMGCRLRGRKAEGVLFHPESFLTEHGTALFRNFLQG